MDFFPFRGQYGGDYAGRLLFLSVRSLVPVISYTLLATTSSRWSIFSRFPILAPARLPPTGDGLQIPLLPDGILTVLQSSLGLPRTSTIIFLGTLLPSFSFALYNALWRRERFPMTGQGGSIHVTTMVNFVDILHTLIFVYSAACNPTWSGDLVRWTPSVLLLGIVLHVVADHSKYLFRGDRRNDGRVLSSGVWGLVRHPNYLGFTIWRVAFATAAGGWAFGAMMLAGFAYLFVDTAVPICEEYMAKKYGIEWRKVTEKVRWRMFPGVW
ncbi:hypothetical protein V1523DRAFT_406416 [Lipomyces doorenjongii]